MLRNILQQIKQDGCPHCPLTLLFDIALRKKRPAFYSRPFFAGDASSWTPPLIFHLRNEPLPLQPSARAVDLFGSRSFFSAAFDESFRQLDRHPDRST